MVVRGLGERGDVVALAGGVFDLGDADDGCVRVDERDEIVRADVASGRAGEPDLRAGAARNATVARCLATSILLANSRSSTAWSLAVMEEL